MKASGGPRLVRRLSLRIVSDILFALRDIATIDLRVTMTTTIEISRGLRITASDVFRDDGFGDDLGGGFELDLDADEPLAVCPMRSDGMGAGDVCEACQ
jgi:hypothetical protein